MVNKLAITLGLILGAVQAHAYGHHSRVTSADSYQCFLSDGNATFKGAFKRTISVNIVGDPVPTQTDELTFEEPLFQLMKSELGPYGCFHGDNEGVSIQHFNVKAPSETLPLDVYFIDDRDDQWSNCEYTAHRNVTVFGEGKLDVSFKYENGGRSVNLTGSCFKQ